jgi:hypothetical protein
MRRKEFAGWWIFIHPLRVQINNCATSTTQIFLLNDTLYAIWRALFLSLKSEERAIWFSQMSQFEVSFVSRFQEARNSFRLETQTHPRHTSHFPDPGHFIPLCSKLWLGLNCPLWFDLSRLFLVLRNARWGVKNCDTGGRRAFTSCIACRRTTRRWLQKGQESSLVNVTTPRAIEIGANMSPCY